MVTMHSLQSVFVRSCTQGILRVRWVTYVLIGTSSVGVLVGLWREEIHLGNFVEEGLVELASNTALGSRSETVYGGNSDKSEDKGELHG